MDIVSNFGKIHSDLQELKSEYMAEQSEMNSYVQLSATGAMMNKMKESERETHLREIK